MRIRRLLVLLPGHAFGAAEAHALRLGRAVAGSGVLVTVAAEGPLLAHLRQDARDGTPSLLDLPVAWQRGSGAAARQAEATRAALDAARPDAVLLALPSPAHGTGAMDVLAGMATPSLVIFHGAPASSMLGGGGHSGPTEDMAAAAMRAEWVAVSAPVAARSERWLGLPAGAVSIIPDSLDRPGPVDRATCRAALHETLGIGPDVPVALFLGRLEAAAGADHLPVLAEAFAERTGGVLAFAGEGILEAALRGSAGAEHPLRFLPVGSDAEALLAGADLLVLPARMAGAPLGFLAAAAHRLPVVASPQALEALGEIAASVAAVADPDDPGVMAEAMADSLDPGGHAGACTEAAWQLTEDWPPEVMVERLLGRLRRLAAPPYEPLPAIGRADEVPVP